MNVEIIRSHRRTIVMIDGRPYVGAGAAQKLGLKRKTYEKRIERGTDLTLPLRKLVWD